jgi:hypothetical protein
LRYAELHRTLAKLGCAGEPCENHDRGTLIIISKTLGTPDFTTIQDALDIMQTEARKGAEKKSRAMERSKVELRNNAVDTKRSITIEEETRA